MSSSDLALQWFVDGSLISKKQGTHICGCVWRGTHVHTALCSGLSRGVAHKGTRDNSIQLSLHACVRVIVGIGVDGRQSDGENGLERQYNRGRNGGEKRDIHLETFY